MSCVLFVCVLFNDAISRPEYKPGASNDNQKKTAKRVEVNDVASFEELSLHVQEEVG
jgi:hypothetical protein